MSPISKRSNNDARTLAATRAVLYVGFVAIAWVALRGLPLVEIGDESETIVTAKLIASGARLYSEVFNHHGPLTFLPGLVVSWFGDPGIPFYRVPMLLGAVGVLVAFAGSPILRSTSRGAVILGLAALLAHFLPISAGNAYLYQTMAGEMIAAALAIYVLPAIFMRAAPVARWRCIVGNGLLASLPFLAVIYIPVTGALIVAALRPAAVRTVVTSVAAAAVVNLAFLAAVGSIAGWLAYHFYLNLVVLPPFLQVSRTGVTYLVTWALAARATWPVGVATAVLFAGVVLRDGSRFRWRALLVIAGLVTLVARGPYVHAIPFYFALSALTLALPWPETRHRAAMVGVSTLLVVLAAVFPGRRVEGFVPVAPIATSDPVSELIDRLTKKDDRILVYTWDNRMYLMSHRLPASGAFFYFPWQAAYERSPVLGIDIDACRDLREHRPKAVIMNREPAFPGRQDLAWSTYGQCIDAVVESNYVKVAGRPLFLRSDVFASSGLASEDDSKHLAVSPGNVLKPGAPLRIPLQPRAAVSRIGLLLGTYGQNYPDALDVGFDDGPSRTLPPATLQDNRYAWFDAGSTLPREIALSSQGNAALTVYGVRDDRTSIRRDCVIYEYADGSSQFTPGCQ